MKKATARPIKNGYPKKAGQYSANLLRLAIMPVCFFMFATCWIFTTVSAPAATLLSARFDSGTDGFLYQDDTFLGTCQPGYAGGTYEPTGGHGGGGLHVTLGGVDNGDIAGMSGGWTYALNLSSDAGGVMLTFRYRLQQSANYEYDEYSFLSRGARSWCERPIEWLFPEGGSGTRPGRLADRVLTEETPLQLEWFQGGRSDARTVRPDRSSNGRRARSHCQGVSA
jgi:hypothetical protein